MADKNTLFYEKPNIDDSTFPIKIKYVYSDESTDVFFKTHWHRHMEFLYFISGKAIIYCDSKPILAEAGDLIVINSNELHQGQNLSSKLARYCIIIDPDIFYTSFMDICETKYISPIVQNYILFQNKISNDKEIKNYIEHMINEYENHENGFELMIKGYIYQLLAILVRKYAISYLTPEEYEKRVENLEMFNSVFEYVEGHYAQKISLQTAVNMVNLSQAHFCRLFKGLTGKTFIEYVNYIRLNKAEQMLKNSDMSVTEIAISVGFSDINYFSRLFKRYKGVSPTDIRKRN